MYSATSAKLSEEIENRFPSMKCSRKSSFWEIVSKTRSSSFSYRERLHVLLYLFLTDFAAFSKIILFSALSIYTWSKSQNDFLSNLFLFQ